MSFSRILPQRVVQSRAPRSMRRCKAAARRYPSSETDREPPPSHELLLSPADGLGVFFGLGWRTVEIVAILR